MFCPNCKVEYRTGFAHCSDCGAELVPALDAATPPRAVDLAVAWRGSDPVALSAVVAALNNAGISNYQIADHDQLAWGLAIPRPRYEVRVRDSDLARARELVTPIKQSLPFVGNEYGLEPPSEWQLPDGRADSESPDDIVESFDPEKATADVWSGFETDTASTLKDCLRENGISSVIAEAGGVNHLKVLPESKARATEIVRQVVEGVPPA